jgi:hypothetical protein
MKAGRDPSTKISGAKTGVQIASTRLSSQTLAAPRQIAGYRPLNG